jgi:hypothetical protein
MRKTLLAAAPIFMVALAPSGSRADAVGAVFGAGTGLVASLGLLAQSWAA